jgi:hypothetical protein
MIGLVAKLPVHNPHHFTQMDGGIQLFYIEDIPGNGVGITGHLRSPRLRPPIAEAVHAFEDQASSFVAHHGPLHASLPTALGRRCGEEHNGPDDLVIGLDGIDTLPPNVLERFLS